MQRGYTLTVTRKLPDCGTRFRPGCVAICPDYAHTGIPALCEQCAQRLPQSFVLWGQFSCKIGHRYMSQPGVTQEWLQCSTATFMAKTDQEVCGGLLRCLSSPQALCSLAPQKWRLVLNLYTGEGLWRQTSISPVTLSADTSRNIGHVPPWRLHRGSGPAAHKRFDKKE